MQALRSFVPRSADTQDKPRPLKAASFGIWIIRICFGLRASDFVLAGPHSSPTIQYPVGEECRLGTALATTAFDTRECVA